MGTEVCEGFGKKELSFSFPFQLHPTCNGTLFLGILLCSPIGVSNAHLPTVPVSAGKATRAPRWLKQEKLGREAGQLSIPVEDPHGNLLWALITNPDRLSSISSEVPECCFIRITVLFFLGFSRRL